jgi:hypothetical protein
MEKIRIRNTGDRGNGRFWNSERIVGIREAITRLNLTLTALQLELVNLVLGLQPRLLLGNLFTE